MRVADHQTNPRSGRPEPHESWPNEVFAIRAMWATAAILGVAAFAAFEQGAAFPYSLLICAVILCHALLATLTWRSLKRKQEAYRRAREAFDEAWSRALVFEQD